MHARTSGIVDGRPGDEARSADGEVPGSQRPWPRHATGRHERPRRRAGRDGRERTGPWRMSFAERVSAGQARLGSLWTLQAVRQPVVPTSRNVAVEKFIYELDALLSGFAQPVPTRRQLKRVVLF